jgi:hypothetical protein
MILIACAAIANKNIYNDEKLFFQRFSTTRKDVVVVDTIVVDIIILPIMG